jgi:hypothetical protein
MVEYQKKYVSPIGRWVKDKNTRIGTKLTGMVQAKNHLMSLGLILVHLRKRVIKSKDKIERMSPYLIQHWENEPKAEVFLEKTPNRPYITAEANRNDVPI